MCNGSNIGDSNDYGGGEGVDDGNHDDNEDDEHDGDDDGDDDEDDDGDGDGDDDDDDDGDDDDVIRSCALRSKCGYAQAFHSISLLDLFLIISHNSLPATSSSSCDFHQAVPKDGDDKQMKGFPTPFLDTYVFPTNK